MVVGSANFGNIRMFLIAHSRLYLFSENAELYSYPLAFPLTPSLPANMTFTTTSQACKNAAPQSWHLFFSQKTLYLLCDERLYTIRNAPTNTIPEPEEMIGYDMYTGVFNIRAMGGSSSSIEIRSPEFLVFTKQQVPYTLKLDGQARTFTNLGSIKVLDSSGHLEREDQNSADVAVTVVSIVVLVLIGALVARCYNRIRREKKSAQDAIQAETGLNATGDVNNKPTPTSGPSNSQAIVPPVELSLNQAAQPVQFQPPTTILPMAPITSTPQQQQAVQNQMQELGFSSHPRPTVASVATGEPWKPTPFVPPASSQRIRSPEQDSSAPTEPILLSPPIPRTSRPRPEVDTQPTRPAVQHPHT
ncbi:hypothetical protein EC991_007772 [Linnemannia zychae]|nr:hypothetical protein EC991_007772 [Linnemannia zychae]